MPEKKRARAYLLKGDDEHRKLETLDKLLKALVAPDFADFDLERMEGNTATSDRIIAGLHIPPFSSTQRVVLVKFANKMDDNEQKKLASALSNAPDSGCLILVNPAAEKDDGRPKRGSEVVGELSRAVRKVGEVHDFGALKTNDAVSFAKTFFQAAGKKVNDGALRTFVQRVGGDSSLITSEAQKLIDYSGDASVITAEDVAQVTSETPEEKVFKLVDAIAAGNAASALRFLSELFDTADDPDRDAPRVLSLIARQFRLLWQAMMLTEAGVKVFSKDKTPDDLKSALPSQPNLLDTVSRQPWMGDRLSRQARSISRPDLARAFRAIAGADRMLKGIDSDVEDPRAIMELLVVELCGGG